MFGKRKNGAQKKIYPPKLETKEREKLNGFKFAKIMVYKTTIFKDKKKSLRTKRKGEGKIVILE